MTDIDYSLLPNPYDFANPISDPKLFVGMRPEIDDVKYYLRHSSQSTRPINLAIVGPRASGKTSMLNVVHAQAQENGLTVARVNLDESDSANEIRFFSKIFDSILTSACEAGAFGGKTGKTYEVYRDMMDAFELPGDSLFSPFIFPRQYAKATAASNPAVLLSDTAYMSDLVCIQEQLKRPIAVLFDESDVLSRNALLLEKLRNIFMNIPGFMLVVAGTPTLFPVMDEVFSPIVRQFKKINLRPFDQLADTKDCIIKPLRAVGADALADTLQDPAIQEIHDLSGGRPYEVQLVCHFMFKRLQQVRTKRMELTVDILDDVRRELEATQDVTARPILAKIRLLTRDQLRALAVLTRSDGRATFEQLWFLQYVLRPNNRWTRETLLAHFDELVNLGILAAQDDVVRFQGDDFDRLYSKYFALTHNVRLYIIDVPFEIVLGMRLHGFLMTHSGIVDTMPSFLTEPRQEMPDLEQVHKDLITGESQADPFTSRSDIAEAVYWCSINARKRLEFTIAAITLSTPWMTIRQCCHVIDESDASESFDAFLQDFQQLVQRAADLGALFELNVKSLPIIPTAILDERLTSTENADARERIGDRHARLMTDAYLERGDIEEALFHAGLALKYARPVPRDLNNIGYVNLAAGHLDTARELFSRSIAEAQADPSPLFPELPTYNLAVLDAKRGDYPASLATLATVAESISSITQGERSCSCLFVPTYSDESLTFPEVREIDLLEATNTAMAAITQANR